MPKLVSEIAPGTQYQFSASEGGVGAALTRVFRILLNAPQEYVDLAQACNIRAGDQHPTQPYLRCTNYEGQFDGDSRMVIIATFTFTADVSWGGDGGGTDGGGGGGTRLSKNPEIRPANWNVSSSMMEVPAYTWEKVNGLDKGFSSPTPAVNPVGDMYDGVTRLEPVVTIAIEQFEMEDPTKHVLHVGKTNEKEIKIGSLTCPRRTVMLRSVQSRAVVEQYGALTYRGWNVSYEFAFRRNKVNAIRIAGVDNQSLDVGWDIAVPQTGLNVKAFNPNNAGNDKEIFGQPLKHSSYKIVGPPYLLPDNIAAGNKVRGMVLVHEYENGGASQSPCAQPIPLNDDGTPRGSDTSPKVIVNVYKVTEEMDFKAELKLRLG